MRRLFSQGVILGPDGNRMSKSRGNVVAPDDQVSRWGADALRCQLMFVGPWDQGGPYNPTGMQGIVRWLNRVWSLVTDEPPADGGDDGGDLRRLTHKTIQAVTDDIEAFRFNTLLSRLMEMASGLQRARDEGSVNRAAWDEASRCLLLMMAPLAPHIAEELWERRGGAYSIHLQGWPAYDASLAQEEEIEVVVQVNGKVRGRVLLAPGATETEARAAALNEERVVAAMQGREPRKVIFVPGRLLNFVV
jgi:leucyl-tRNA synthetase